MSKLPKPRSLDVQEPANSWAWRLLFVCLVLALMAACGAGVYTSLTRDPGPGDSLVYYYLSYVYPDPMGHWTFACAEVAVAGGLHHADDVARVTRGLEQGAVVIGWEVLRVTQD